MNNMYEETEVLYELDRFCGMQVGGILLICSTPYVTTDQTNETLQVSTIKNMEKVATLKKSEQKVPLMLIPYSGSPLAHEKRVKRRRLDFDVEEINFDADETRALERKVDGKTKKTKKFGGKRLRMDD